MTFLNEIKQTLSEFVSETRKSLHWTKTEIVRQYHLAILKEIRETYPTTYPYIDTVYEIVDGLAQDKNCPDFVETPKPTDISSDFDLNDPIFDGLNEPDYPYDTEPSA